MLPEDDSVLRIPTSAKMTLEFEKAYPDPDDPYVVGMLVRATGDHVQVEQQVILLGTTGDLGRFFRTMYDDFRGWSGERAWRSLEDELRVTAWHDGHVHLRWDVTNSLYEEDSWAFSVTTHHGAGEDMRRLADAFEELLNPPQ